MEEKDKKRLAKKLASCKDWKIISIGKKKRNNKKEIKKIEKEELMIPTRTKKLILQILDGDKELWKIWKGFYDEAIKDLSPIPTTVAWIKFRNFYTEDPGTGKWVEILRR